MKQCLGRLTAFRDFLTIRENGEVSSEPISREMKAGASEYILKSAGRADFLKAIRTIAADGEQSATR